MLFVVFFGVVVFDAFVEGVGDHFCWFGLFKGGCKDWVVMRWDGYR